jgi:hypothetical protein
MESKSIRNLIIKLLVLAGGVWLIINLSSSYTDTTSVVGLPTNLTESVDSLGTLFLYGLGVLILLLIPLYIYARREENSGKRRNIQPQPRGTPQYPRQS